MQTLVKLGAYRRHFSSDGVHTLQHLAQRVVVESIVGQQVEYDNALPLAIAVKAAGALHQPGRIPGQVIINQNVAAFVQVEPFAARFGRDHKLRRFVEVVNALALFLQAHAPVD